MFRDEIEKRMSVGLEVSSKIPAKDQVAIVIGTAEDLSQTRLSQAKQNEADGVEAVLSRVTRAALFAS